MKIYYFAFFYRMEYLLFKPLHHYIIYSIEHYC
ncbi:hypothetical protein APED_22280 [Acanthopleuribacter pedis]